MAWGALNVSPFKAGDNALVVGGGPIGIGVVQVLKLQGAKETVVVELVESRRQLARDFGATRVLDPREVDVPEVMRELTSGIGADVVFDNCRR